MNLLDRKFKELLQDRINERFLEAQINLVTPITKEISSDLHEIGSLRGYAKAMREIYDECNFIMKQLTEPENLEKK